MTAATQAAAKPIPVILNTDIGGDIDDTWALGFLLRCPELDLKLALGEFGNPTYRATLLSKFLTAAGRTGVPVGVGIESPAYPSGPLPPNEAIWMGDAKLGDYAGTVHKDGVGALIDIVMNSPEPVTVVTIAAPINLAEALRREPRIAGKIRFVGMFGSVRKGYANSPVPCAEANVKMAPDAVREVFAAPWKEAVITPLDTCGLVRLQGERYQAMRASADPIAREILADYRIFLNHPPGWVTHPHPEDYETRSSALFDPVAVYLAFSRAGLKIEKLPLRVTDDGMTVIDPEGPTLEVATEWTDREGFERLLAERLIGH